MALKTLILLIYFLNVYVGCVNSERSNEAIDSSLLESVLDAEECDLQIRTIRSNSLLLIQFADAGIRMPKGVLIGSTVDLGNYHQCLGIDNDIDGMNIQGKFCSISVPINQTFNLPGFEYTQEPWSSFPSSVYLDEERIKKIEQFNLRRAEILAMSGDLHALEEYYARTVPPNPLSSVVLTLGVCVPKPCTTQQAMTSLLFNLTAVGFDYTENYCRMSGDKPWAGADYTAVIIFSIIGFITLLSTGYDLLYRFVLKIDLKAINPICQSFSVYTNGQRLATFSAGPGTMQCIDGIRTLAMIWVILGHSFGSEPHIANILDAWAWMLSESGLWVTAATATVDTFFTLGGILLVYTSAKKMTGQKFLSNLHWFYIGRIVRITPLLAAAVVLEASFYNHLGDGPSWGTVAYRTERCRNDWWYTLLHVQNLLIPRDMGKINCLCVTMVIMCVSSSINAAGMVFCGFILSIGSNLSVLFICTHRVSNESKCVSQSWYVAIDMHMYVVSPLIIYWIFTGKKRNAWIALVSGLLAVLAASTAYNFVYNFQAGVIVPNRGEDNPEYMPLYYFNTLARASPFFVGLIFGYVLHLYRDTKVNMPWIIAIIFWLISIGIVGGILYFKYIIMQFDWDNQFVDNFMNSFMRPAWACFISWMIFACVHGYAGPINWFLSLDMWRLPARLTYGMYLFHYPLMFAINGTAVTPVHFSVGLFTFKFLAHLASAIVLSYILTVIVDAPFTALYRELMVKVLQQQVKQEKRENKGAEIENINNKEQSIVAQSTDGKLNENLEANGDNAPEK